jgi:hypothetical protein
MPPKTPEEEAFSREMVQTLQSLARDLQQRNLASAVALAQQALSGRGPLVAHFAELGRRFGHTLREPAKPSLRVVEGGRN